MEEFYWLINVCILDFFWLDANTYIVVGIMLISVYFDFFSLEVNTCSNDVI